MDEMDDFLKAVFHRRACPEPEKLGDYHLGRLAPGERLVLALHLRECRYCTDELALYAAAEAQPQQVGLGAGLRDWVSRVLWLRPFPGTAQAPALRGAARSSQLYESADLRVVLEVQPALSGYRRKRLVGQIEPAGGVIAVELWDRTALHDSLLLNDMGFFAFDRLKPGPYFLCIRRNGVEAWLEVVV